MIADGLENNKENNQIGIWEEIAAFLITEERMGHMLIIMMLRQLADNFLKLDNYFTNCLPLQILGGLKF